VEEGDIARTDIRGFPSIEKLRGLRCRGEGRVAGDLLQSHQLQERLLGTTFLLDGVCVPNEQEGVRRSRKERGW